MHVLLNEMKELAAQKKVPHRDFYNIRKVLSLSTAPWPCHITGLAAEPSFPPPAVWAVVP